MPRRRVVDKVRMKMKVPFCRFCRKTITRKEIELHLLVCEKVPQEIFNDPNSQSFQDVLGR